jgi:CDGSH-type Zn-finger protein/uncharacterized Fe-S cluster protein YjdI
MSKKEYKGKNFTIYFDDEKCMHSRFCVLGQPKVFQANTEEPWIKPENCSAEELSEVAHNCPSGAITYKRHDGVQNESAPQVNTIRILENGPYGVRAEMKIDNSDEMNRATLCRCGASKNKPFCDCSHVDSSFEATGEPLTTNTLPLEKRNGILDISQIKDGPLIVDGNVEIIAGTGRAVKRAVKVVLCRCGASKNKPFCDGTHTGIGFKT